MSTKKSKFYEMDRLDFMVGAIISILCVLGLLGLYAFENNGLPLAVALLTYVIFLGIMILKKRSFSKGIRTTKTLVGRIGWFITMGI